MAIKKRFLRSPLFLCDRCHKPVRYGLHALCDECYKISSSQIRRVDVLNIRTSINGRRICDMCGKEIYSNQKDVCYECVSTHLDNSHFSSFNTSPPPTGYRRAHYCYKCGGVQVVTTIDEKEKEFEYLYYKLGSKYPSKTPFECTDVIPNNYCPPDKCLHDWIILDSDISSTDKTLNWKDFQKMFGVDNYMIETLKNGLTFFWCWKCGYFLKLMEKDYNRLPLEGDIKEF